MFRRFYLSIRNILLYRSPRPGNGKVILRDVQNTGSLEEIKTLLTAILLRNVGLRLNGNPIQGIYLTKCQRNVIKQVTAFGYRPGV